MTVTRLCYSEAVLRSKGRGLVNGSAPEAVNAFAPQIPPQRGFHPFVFDGNRQYTVVEVSNLDQSDGASEMYIMAPPDAESARKRTCCTVRQMNAAIYLRGERVGRGRRILDDLLYVAAARLDE